MPTPKRGRPATGRKRPSLSASVAPETLSEIKRLSSEKYLSGGEVVDELRSGSFFGFTDDEREWIAFKTGIAFSTVRAIEIRVRELNLSRTKTI